MNIRNTILSYMEKDSHLNAKTLAVMLNLPEEEIEKEIAAMEADGTILSYKTVVNWEIRASTPLRSVSPPILR